MELQHKRSRNSARSFLENDYARTKSRNKSTRLRRRKTSTKVGKTIQYSKQKLTILNDPHLSSRISHLNNSHRTAGDKPPSEDLSAQFSLKMNEKENDDIMSSSSSSSNFNDMGLDSEYDHFNNMITLSTENAALYKRYEREHADRLMESFESEDNVLHSDNNDVMFWPNNTVSNDSGKHISPWIDLIMPGYSQPYCTRVSISSQKGHCCSENCPFSYSFTVDKSDQKLLYITPNQMYLITENIMSQIMKAQSGTPTIIDWLEVSKASKLSKNVCKEFWWSFNKGHIKDDCDGCIISVNCQHYYKVDEAYYIELKNRVRQLLNLAKESKEEQERIISTFKSDIYDSTNI